MKQLYPLLFAVVCCLLGCRDDVDPSAFIVTKANFGYPESTTYDLVPEGQAVQYLVGVDGKIIYSTYLSEIRVFDSERAEETDLMYQVRTFEIEVDGHLVYFCTDKGMFRLDLDGPQELERIASSCEQLEVVNDAIYYTTYDVDSSNLHSNVVYRLMDGDVQPLTDALPTTVSKLAALPSDELMVLSAGIPKTIYRLDLQGKLIDAYDPSSYYFPEDYLYTHAWATITKDELLLVGYSGFDYPSITSWSVDSGRWTDLLVPETLEPQASGDGAKLDYLRNAIISEALALNGQLYVTTRNNESCLGLFRFDLNGSRPFALDDFTVIQDTRIGEDQCLQGIYHDEGADALYLYTQRSVVKFQ